MHDFIYYEFLLNSKDFLWNEKACESLCLNEKACDFIKKHFNIMIPFIDWCSICSNPCMIPLIEDNFDKLSFLDFSILFSENKNINDLSSSFICKVLDKALLTFTEMDDDYDQITEDDYVQMIIDEICKKCNKINILKKYIPQFIEIGIFYDECLDSIAQNPYAFPIIFEYFDKIKKTSLYLNLELPIKYVIFERLNFMHLESLSFNKKMLPILQLYVNQLNIKCWNNLCEIEDNNTINFIDENINKLDYLCWSSLCKNKCALNLIKKHFKFIMNLNDKHKDQYKNLWSDLSENENKELLDILEQNIENIDWKYFSANKNIIYFLRKYPRYIEKIDLEVGSKNRKLIFILMKNKNIILKSNIFYYEFLKNPALFQIKYDYKKIKDTFFFSPVGQGLIPIISHPHNYYCWQRSVFSEEEMDEVNSSNFSLNLDLSKNIILQILKNEKKRKKLQETSFSIISKFLSDCNENKKRKRE